MVQAARHENQNASLVKGLRLKKYYLTGSDFLSRDRSVVRAVDGVDVEIKEGEAFGLVGESGSGKTTLARLLIRLIEPTEGEILFEGRSISHLEPEELRSLRCDMQMVFQDPYSSLSPRMSIKGIVGEPLLVHHRAKGTELTREVQRLLTMVGLGPEALRKRPREFSGGQRQRIALARALALSPKLLVLDEPTSALDVSVQAQMMNLLQGLRQELGLTFLFISHDLAVVSYLCDRAGVMYLGKLVEVADTRELFLSARHPYTQALIASVPVVGNPTLLDRPGLEGDIALGVVSSGCRFHPRCRAKMGAVCEKEDPELVTVSDGHLVACHLYQAQEQKEASTQ